MPSFAPSSARSRTGWRRWSGSSPTTATGSRRRSKPCACRRIEERKMDLRMMIPILALLIPIVAILAGVMKHYLKLKEREIEAVTKQSAEKAAQYASQTERLEQRVRVLERIVTDKGIDVADEIERLRDQRPVN